MTRVDVKAILRDPAQRRELMTEVIIATQAREGVTTTKKQAGEAYDRVRKCQLCRKPDSNGLVCDLCTSCREEMYKHGLIKGSR